MIRIIRLKPVESIRFVFDPFATSSLSIRALVNHFNRTQLRMTNPECSVRHKLVFDRASPEMQVNFIDGQKTIIRTENFTDLEAMKILDRLCEQRDPRPYEMLHPPRQKGK